MSGCRAPHLRTDHGTLERKKWRGKKRYLYILFTDSLVWLSASSYKFKGMVYLKKVSVHATDDPLAFDLAETMNPTYGYCGVFSCR